MPPSSGSWGSGGSKTDQGLLCVLDGSKGLRKAVQTVFEAQAMVQRCQWHKRKNVVEYLPKGQQAWPRKLQQAYERSSYAEAKAALLRYRQELRLLNESAVTSLDEGFEETLTLHRLGVFGALGTSLKTTNCLESVNALVEHRTARSPPGRPPTRSAGGSPRPCSTSNPGCGGSEAIDPSRSSGPHSRRRSEDRRAKRNTGPRKFMLGAASEFQLKMGLTQRFFYQRLAGLEERPRPGRPRVFPPEVVVQVKAIACELPATRGLPLARLSTADIVREAQRCGLVATLSDKTV